MPGLMVDLILASGLVLIGLRVVTGRALFRDIVLFIVFGLVIAIIWSRLGAPDLALAEAAIGAGVTGALMLMAYRRLRHGEPEAGAGAPAAPAPRPSWLAVPVALLAAVAVAVVGLAAVGVEGVVDSGGAAALAATPATGLGNPVTGVLLVFRGLDTLLEMLVLLVVLLGAWAVMIPGPPGRIHLVSRHTPLVGVLLTIVAPLAVLVAVHLLVAGADEPGGAFQAGAVLAAGGVLLVLTGVLRPTARAGALVRLSALAGLIAFVTVGAGALAFGRPIMALSGSWTVYLIEAAMMVSIAVTLTLLFARAGGLARGGS
jgi:multisubunit Na+/H+ antiporter MnhB subunit